VEIISRERAKQVGLKKFFTEEPCKNGHVAERYVSSGGCVDCSKASFKNLTEEQLLRRAVNSKRRYEEKRDEVLQCSREWYVANKDRVREKQNKLGRERYSANKNKFAEKAKNYRKRNKEEIAAKMARWQRENKDLVNAATSKRRAAKTKATPAWVTSQDFKNISAVYTMAARLTSCLGVEHHVDHIVPLRGDVVCGLHVPWNLAVIPAKLNISKGNKLSIPEVSYV